MMENITNCDNITNLKQIRLTCGQEIKENEDNLFHEKVYRKLLVNVVSNDNSIEEKSLTMGQLLRSNTGNPLMVFLGITLLKDECSKLFLRGSYAAFIDVQKHYQILTELILLMRSIVTVNNEDEFQKKTDAVSAVLGTKAKETGVTITNIISVERSSINQIESLRCLGGRPSFDIESFLLSTLDEATVIPVVHQDSFNLIEEEELTAVGIILFALFQQRSNNPPDARFESCPYPQLLNDIPFHTTFMSEENSLSVVFTAISEHSDRRDDAPVDHVVDLVDDDSSTNINQSPGPLKKRRGRRPTQNTTSKEVCKDNNTEDNPPRLAKRARTQNSKYIPPEANHKNNIESNGGEEVLVSAKKRGGRKKAAPNKVKVVQPLRPSSPVSDIEEPSPIIIHHKQPKVPAQPKSTVDFSNSTQHQQSSNGGSNQQIELIMTKLHEFDKQNAVLRAQLDFSQKNVETTKTAQQEMKAFCFEVLDKGNELNKNILAVATENHTALSNNHTALIAAATTGSRREDVFSGTVPTTSKNHMTLPVVTAAPPTVVNLSTQSLLSTEESSRVSISPTPLTTVVQQQHPVQTTITPPSNSIGLPSTPQHQLLLPQTPQPPTVTPFYPTIQVNAGSGVSYPAHYQQQYFAQQQAHVYYQQGPPPTPYTPSPAPMHGVPGIPQPSYQGYPPPSGGFYFPHNQQPSYRGGYPPSFY